MADPSPLNARTEQRILRSVFRNICELIDAIDQYTDTNNGGSSGISAQMARDYHSTTYMASYEPAEPFSRLLRVEARQMGVGCSTQVVVLNDGAAWCEVIAEHSFARSSR